MVRGTPASRARRAAALVAGWGVCVFTLPEPPHALARQRWSFRDVTREAGLDHLHGYRQVEVGLSDAPAQAAGAAAGDFDNDGWVDLYFVRGDIGHDLLLRNQGDGTFRDVSPEAGLAGTARRGAGPLFFDADGDGWLDLLVLAVATSRLAFYRNRGGRFEDATLASGIRVENDTYSAAASDYDRDGDLDLFVTQWGAISTTAHLLRNRGGASFEDADQLSGIADSFLGFVDFSFTPNFADIDGDRWPDLLLASDFHASAVFRNDRGTFVRLTVPALSDENGMGAAVGDYDNDGDLDWFVSSIWDDDGFAEGPWQTSGNRLYRNEGGGSFSDATDATGVRRGYWGWGSTFADLNNDGHLDLVHVNGFGRGHPESAQFHADPTVLFVAQGDGSFRERASELGLRDSGQGRGVIAFDYDRDGDLDLFIANNQEAPKLFRNDLGNDVHFLGVRLAGRPPNTEAVGARVYATAGGATQMRELRAGSNYVSQDPVAAHFGLGTSSVVERLEVLWPDGGETVLEGVAADQWITLSEPPATTAATGAFVRGDANESGRLDIADAIAVAARGLLGAVLACDDAGDVNDDGRVDLSDLAGALAHLFAHAPPPAAPFPECGRDATDDALGCGEQAACAAE